MKVLLFVLAFTYASLATANVTQGSDKFVKELEFFQPYLGTWYAVFEEKDGKPVVSDVTHWQRVLNGKGLKTVHSVNDGAYGGESIIYWDKKLKKYVFYYFTTADFMTVGEIEILSENSFVAYEDVDGESEMSKGITQVRSISTLSADKLTVETSYLKNGEWTKPESRSYSRSDKQVKFK